MNVNAQVAVLREATAYIGELRGRCIVVHLAADHLMDEVGADTIVDLVRLQQFGARIILVLGLRFAIDALTGEGHPLDGPRISDDALIDLASQSEKQMMQRVESVASVGINGQRGSVVNGNFIKARPLGVINGVDHLKTGVARRIDKSSIAALTEAGNILQIGPIHYSMSGERYNLRTDALAMKVAVAVGADKLIYMHNRPGVSKATHLSPAAAEALAADGAPHAPLLRYGAEAIRHGVQRVHLLCNDEQGALLQELLSRDGIGQLISADRYEGLRKAKLEDVPGILAIVEPLEQSGALVERGRQRIELEIEHFSVIERDGLIIACCALLPIAEDACEVACLAIHEQYRGQGRGEAMLDHLLGAVPDSTSVFALSTQSGSWFHERGFIEVPAQSLPEARRARYDAERGSKVLQYQAAAP